MKYSVKFYPEKRKETIDNQIVEVVKNVPVMCSVAWSGKRMFHYTGKRCNINQWDPILQELKRNQVTLNGESFTIFNADLTDIKGTINNLFKVYDINRIVPSVDQLREDLKKGLGKPLKITVKNRFFDYFSLFISSGEYSPGAQTTLKYLQKMLEEFNPDLTFENLNPVDFQAHLAKMSSIGKNTISLNLNWLRTFINFAKAQNYTQSDPFKGFKIKSAIYGTPIYISLEERDNLYDVKIDDPDLSIVRDIFVTQCYIGCRYSDLMRLNQTNIIDNCIQYIASKTKNKTVRIARIPLSKKVKTIFSRYHLPDGRLLPFIKIVSFDKALKALFFKVKINRKVTITDKITGLDKQVPLYIIASSHMARRCFIGGLYKKGVKNATIASMSGHAKDSKAFSRYYDIDQEDQEAAMKLIQ